MVGKQRVTARLSVGIRALLGGMMLLALSPLHARGAGEAPPGRLDAAFGVQGHVTTDFGGSEDYATAVISQPDGKIVLAGYSFQGDHYVFALARYNPGGDLDAGFGDGGQVITDLKSGDAYANALAILPDGRLLAAGAVMAGSGYDFALARYLPDGQPDATFGAGGTVVSSFGAADDAAYALALQSDGSFYTAGYATPADHTVFALARFQADGALDPAFGGGGRLTVDPSGGDASLRALALQPDGNLVAVGSFQTGVDLQDVALARFLPDGRLDPAFNHGQVAHTDFFHDDDFGNAVALQPDGKPVVVGVAWSNLQTDLALLRYNPDGTLDPGFQSAGKGIISFASSANDIGSAVQLQADGQIVAAGASNGAFALARLNPDGSLDPSFGAAGLVTTTFQGEDMLQGLALQPDGLILAAGRAYDGQQSDFALARFDTRLVGSALADDRALAPLGSTGAAAQFAPGHACTAGRVTATRLVRSSPGLARSLPAAWQISTDCAGEYNLRLTLTFRSQELAIARAEAVHLAVYYSPDGQEYLPLGGAVDAAFGTVTVAGITSARAGGYLTLAEAPAAQTTRLFLPAAWLQR